MKKIPLLLVILAVALGLHLGFRGYRTYQADLVADLERQRLAAENKALEEQARRVSAELEAQRLADLQEWQAAKESARKLDLLQAEQTATALNLAQAEQEYARLKAETVRLSIEKEKAVGEARRLTELREQEAVEAEIARQGALQKLRTLEAEKSEQADIEAARLADHVAALEAQQVREERLRKIIRPRARIIHPVDYKPRDHHNLRSILAWETYEKELEAAQQASAQDIPADLPK